MKAPMHCRRAFTFKQRHPPCSRGWAQRATFVVVLLMLAGRMCMFGGDAEAASMPLAAESTQLVASLETDSLPEAAEDLPAGEFHVFQSVSMGIGTFHGDKTSFIKHEDRVVPSLNPEISLQGNVRLRTWLSPELHVRLQTPFVGEGKTTFGVGWRAWDAEYGSHSLSFSPAGLAYVKSSDGLRLRYQQTGQAPALQAVFARSNTRAGDVEIRGDDGFGPFFLGYKRIVPESERVAVGETVLKRGTGPSDGDYYVDYDGGFLYFNRIFLQHEKARVIFEYHVEDPGLASDFSAAIVGREGAHLAVHAFVLRDYTPLDELAIVEQTGTTLHAYGGRFQWDTSSGWQGTTSLLATELHRRTASTRDVTDVLALTPDTLRYTLRRRPVLYESERVLWIAPNAEPVELLRHLDYTVNYHTGELIFAFEPTEGARATVHYRHVDGATGIDGTVLRGVRTVHRVDYSGNKWRTSAWLDTTGDGYVQVNNLREPAQRLSSGLQTRYDLGGGWGIVGESTVVGQKETSVWSSATGIHYGRGRWDSRLRLGRDVHVAGPWTELGSTSTTATDHVSGGLAWRGGAAEAELDFKQPLHDYRGGLPEHVSASALVRIGSWPVAVKYTHGDAHHLDKIETRLTIPMLATHTRGFTSIGAQWLFADGFGDTPRTVYSGVADVVYSPPDGAYARGRATLSLSSLGSVTSETGLLSADVGRGLGETGVIDYQLRLSGRQTGWHGGPGATRLPTDEHYSASHMITWAGAVWPRAVPGLTGSLLWRRSAAERWRPDRGRTRNEEGGWQVSLHADVGRLWQARRSSGQKSDASHVTDADDMQVTLSYDASRSHVTVPSARTDGSTVRKHGSYGGDATTTDVRTMRLAVAWAREPFSLRTTLEAAVFDDHRRRGSLEVTPTYALSEQTRVWIAYEYVSNTMTDAPSLDGRGQLPEGDRGASAGEYTVHSARAGMTIEF